MTARVCADPQLNEDGTPLLDVSGNMVSKAEHAAFMTILEAVMSVPDDLRYVAFCRVAGGFMATKGFTRVPT